VTWSIVGVGTLVEVTTTTHTLVEPASVAAGDLLVAVLSYRGVSSTSVTLPSGWTLVNELKTGNSTAGGTTSRSNVTMAYIVRGSSAPALTFTLPVADIAQGRIVAYRSDIAGGTIALDVSTAAATTTGITSINVAQMVTVYTDELIVGTIGSGRSVTLSAFKSASGPATASGATDTTSAPDTSSWIERADTGTATGNDVGVAVFDGVIPAAGATGNFTATASAGSSYVVVVGAFRAVYPSIADAWNVNDKSPSTTMSNSDKTATTTLATVGIRSTTLRANGTAGKYYAEFLINTASSVLGRVGITPASATINVATANIWVQCGNGNVVINSVTVGNVGAVVSSGDTVCMAWDAGAERIWFRKNGGLWNNDAAADPATGTNGLDGSFLASGDQGLWFYSGAAGAVTTVRTEWLEFTQAIPSGFASWMGETSAPVNVSTTAAGQSVTASVGQLSVVGNASHTVAGQAVTAAVGQVGVTAGVSVNHTVSGQSVTASVGQVTVTASGNLNHTVSGQSVTASVGQVTVSGKASHTIAGQQLTTGVGQVGVVGKASLTLPGQQLTVGVGQVSVAAGGAITIIPAGQQLTASVGQVTVTASSAAAGTWDSMLGSWDSQTGTWGEEEPPVVIPGGGPSSGRAKKIRRHFFLEEEPRSRKPPPPTKKRIRVVAKEMLAEAEGLLGYQAGLLSRLEAGVAKAYTASAGWDQLERAWSQLLDRELARLEAIELKKSIDEEEVAMLLLLH
jgi:hypothetical protein